MRRHPLDGGAEVDPMSVVAAEERPCRAGRPWVLVNMIASLDGATAIDGRSGGLGGPGDKALFRAIRAVADVILVGAGTVRAEDYGPPVLAAETVATRVGRGQAPTPRLVIVSGRLELSPTARVFTDAEHRPMIATHAGAPAERRAALTAVAQVEDFGEQSVELASVLTRLRSDGAQVVVCEGGPKLNTALFASDLVDELCLTVAPLIIGGASKRIVEGSTGLRPFILERLLSDDGFLFLRYLRQRDAGDQDASD
jgi:riboflavin-specific deaminase-like protein